MSFPIRIRSEMNPISVKKVHGVKEDTSISILVKSLGIIKVQIYIKKRNILSKSKKFSFGVSFG